MWRYVDKNKLYSKVGSTIVNPNEITSQISLKFEQRFTLKKFNKFEIECVARIQY